MFLLQIVGLFGIIALGLSAVGIYGLLSYDVGVRARELALRIVLGSPPANVALFILRDLLSTLSFGLIAGIASLMAASHILATMLYGIQPLAVPALVTAAAASVVVTLLSAFGPCHRIINLKLTAVFR